MKAGKPYEKHVYWIDEEEEARLRGELAGKRVRLKRAKGVVCTPLDEINRIASVPPEVWNDTCGRQGSWYRESEKRGLFLIVSSFPLHGWETKKSALITRSDFTPPGTATVRDIEGMVGNADIRPRVPRDWSRASDFERRLMVRWAKRIDPRAPEYEELFLTHTANHANFIKPRFHVREGGKTVPYSIAPSARVCSCCLELFNVLGEEYEKKYVVPCPGAIIFSRLRPDEFLLVRTPGA